MRDQSITAQDTDPDTAPRPIQFVDLQAQRARIAGEIDAAIARVLEHGRFILGPEVAELESRLSEIAGTHHAITCSSGTTALLITMMAQGIGPGDAVLVPTFTYVATAEAVKRSGATPVFVDVEADSFNLGPATLAPGLATARAAGLVPRGIIAVDLFGQPADYDAIEAFAAAEGLWLLSDAAQSFGARYKSRRAGGCGTFAATSFFPAKPLGCYGDGGAIFTDDTDFAQLCESIRFHGQGKDHWHNERIGMTGRLDTIQAAVLLAKLGIFEDELATRRAIAARYHAGLGNHVTTPRIGEDRESVWAQYTIRVPQGRRDAVVAALESAEIPSAVYYRTLVAEQPAYRDCPVAEGGTPVAHALTGEVMSLPIHPYLLTDDQDRVIAAVRAAL